jgi:hypothetical protein
LGNACDRGVGSLVLNYVKDIIDKDIIGKLDVSGDNWKVTNNNLVVNMPCLNPDSKLIYNRGV